MRILTCKEVIALYGVAHETVTKRSFKKIKAFIDDSNTALDGISGPLKPIDVSEIANGSDSLLSLGEGRSSFIFGLLGLRRKLGLATNNIHAVDMIYDENALQLEMKESDWYDNNPSAIWIRSRARLKRFLKSFPENYHAQSFVSLDLRDAGGSRRLFDEVISSNSVSYILGQSHKFDTMEDLDEHDLKVLANILSHTRDGGHIRIFPVFQSFSNPFNRYAHLQRLLNRLLKEGKIKNHNYIFRDPPQDLSLIFQNLIIQK